MIAKEMPDGEGGSQLFDIIMITKSSECVCRGYPFWKNAEC
jgi:hypothetical protein